MVWNIVIGLVTEIQMEIFEIPAEKTKWMMNKYSLCGSTPHHDNQDFIGTFEKAISLQLSVCILQGSHSHGKSGRNLWSWKVMENQKISKFIEM